jgi:hypothetical protein
VRRASVVDAELARLCAIELNALLIWSASARRTSQYIDGLVAQPLSRAISPLITRTVWSLMLVTLMLSRAFRVPASIEAADAVQRF